MKSSRAQRPRRVAAGARSPVSAKPLVPIVGVGASAGGLEAFREFLSPLPLDTGMAFVLVQHLDPQHESALTQLLSRATRMPVVEASEHLRAEPNHVYVIPRNTQLRLERGVLTLQPRSAARGQQRPIDTFFESLAEEQGERAIGVVLSGTGTDGTTGLEAIKAEGGITFAQDDSARFDAMPRSAIAAGCVDFELAPREIAAELARIARHPFFSRPARPTARSSPEEDRASATRHGNDRSPLPSGGRGSQPIEVRRMRREAGHPAGSHPNASLEKILLLLRSHSGVDFSLYKSATIERRINRRVVLGKYDTLSRYADHLRGNGKELDALYSDVLISVTSFFRNPEAFELLKKKVFPRLLSGPRDEPLRVWVLGCSTGQEAYSIAMAFVEAAEKTPRSRALQVFATDLNDTLLEKARRGLYARTLAEDLSPERLRRFFVEEEGGYRISKSLREMVVFARQNFVTDPPFSRIDLISCRNLLIYLEPELQKKIFPTFHYALKPGGFLFLGASESVGAFTDLFEHFDKKQKIFSKRVAPPAALRLPLKKERAGGSPADARLPLAGATTGEDQPGVRSELGAQREADRLTLNQFAPPGVLIDSELRILQFRGPTSSFLTPPSGKATFDLLKMAREGLMLPLRSAIQKAKKENKVVRRHGVRIAHDGSGTTIGLQVIPLRNLKQKCFLVLFESEEKAVPGARKKAGRAAPAPAPVKGWEETRRIAELEETLAETRDYLQSLQEQHEAASEELQASNEEVQSANEELQSINEELETSKEELESANEELTTVNEEMASRNAELNLLNGDLLNLHASIRQAIILLDRDLTIRRFSVEAEKLFHLTAADIGRPLNGIRHDLVFEEDPHAPSSAFTAGEARERVGQAKRGRGAVDLGGGNARLDALVAQVIDTVRETEREVRDVEGHHFSLRVMPYLTVDKRVDGAVLVLVDVDALKQSEQTTARARDYAESIIRSVRDPIVVLTGDLRVENANEAFYSTFGVVPEDSRGKSIFELGDGQWNISKLRQLLTDVLVHHRAFDNFEVTHDFPSVGRRTMLLGGRPLGAFEQAPANILLGIQDVTEMLQYQTAMRESQGRYRALIEASSQIVWTADPHGRVVDDSPSWREFTGQSFEQWKGSGWLEAIHPEDRARTREMWMEAIAAGTPVETEYRLRRADGAWRWTLVRALPVHDTNGAIREWIGMNTDITERKAVQSELAQRAEDLANVDAARGRFLAVLSHELRAPLNAIRSWTQIMRRPAASAEDRERGIEVIERNSRLQGELINDLLDAHRIGAGKATLSLEGIDLAEAVQAAVTAVEPAMHERGIYLVRDLDPGPVPVLADPARLQQVFGNVLANAMKFTPAGGQIQVSLRTNGGFATVSVTDSGEGLSEEAIPLIFEPFRQADSSANKSHGGLGLGLSVARQLMTLHGGSIEASSEGRGKGARFTITIPLHEATAQSAHMTFAEGSEGNTSEVLSGVMVLVVDDEPDAREAVRYVLEDVGAEVIAVSSVRQALAAIREQRPDILVSDLAMPGVDGFELLRSLRALPPGRGGRIPVIALTALGAPKDREMALQAGFARYLVKPVESRDLVAAVVDLAKPEHATHP